MKELIKSTTAYKILKGDCSSDKLSHAYMLHFPDLKNLKEALKIFAVEFFGAKENSNLYHRIINCSYPDFKLYPADGKKLTADAIGEILDDCSLKPVEGKLKLYVISEFDSCSALLQNKLLKTLEEPLPGIYFLLGAVSLAPVLDTVKSRVKLLEIPPFSEEQIFSALERKKHSEINSAAAKSAGGILGAAENIVSGGWFEEVNSAAKEICSAVRLEDIGVISVKYGDTKYKSELLSEMQRHYFSALKEGGALTRPALIFALERLNSAFADLKFNAVFQGLLFDFMLAVAEENKRWTDILAK